MEVAVRAGIHLGPRAAVVLVVGLRIRVVPDRRGKEARVGKRWRGHDTCAQDVTESARGWVGNEPRAVVVAVELGVAAVGACGAVAVPRLVQVGIEAGGSVAVHVSQDCQLRRPGEVGGAPVGAEGQKRRGLPLVAHDRRGRGADRDRQAAAEDLHERQRQVVVRRVHELVAVELGVGGDDSQRVAAGEGVGEGVLAQRARRSDVSGQLARRLDAGVDAEVLLVKADRAGDGQTQVRGVLVPVAGVEGGGVDGRLLFAPVDVAAARVDREAEHAEQHQDQDCDQNDRLALLQVRLARQQLSWSIQHGRPHMQ